MKGRESGAARRFTCSNRYTCLRWQGGGWRICPHLRQGALIAAAEPPPLRLRGPNIGVHANEARYGALILANASCIGSAETTSIPSNGESRSAIRTTAPAIERAPTTSAAITNPLRGAKRPILKNRIAHHDNT